MTTGLAYLPLDHCCQLLDALLASQHRTQLVLVSCRQRSHCTASVPPRKVSISLHDCLCLHRLLNSHTRLVEGLLKAVLSRRTCLTLHTLHYHLHLISQQVHIQAICDQLECTIDYFLRGI